MLQRRRIFKQIAIIIAKILAPLFYSRRYLAGRHFADDGGGWIWALKGIWFQKILGFNRRVPWPVSPFVTISNPENIVWHPDDLNNFQSPGCYWQNFAAKIVVGRGTYIAPNVGLITANHDPLNLDQHLAGQDIILGESCWIGMNAVILPGVELGPHTIVAAGAVVTKSFPEGYCIIGGVPAKILRRFSPEEVALLKGREK